MYFKKLLFCQEKKGHFSAQQTVMEAAAKKPRSKFKKRKRNKNVRVVDHAAKKAEFEAMASSKARTI